MASRILNPNNDDNILASIGETVVLVFEEDNQEEEERKRKVKIEGPGAPYCTAPSTFVLQPTSRTAMEIQFHALPTLKANESYPVQITFEAGKGGVISSSRVVFVIAPAVDTEPVFQPEEPVSVKPPTRPTEERAKQSVLDIPKSKIDFVPDVDLENPAEGQEVFLYPGQSARIAIRIKNETQFANKIQYKLNLKSEAPPIWYPPIAVDKSLDKGDSAWLEFKIAPPVNAKASTFKLVYLFGPVGKPEERTLIVEIGARPAVALTTQAPQLCFGPFAKEKPFELDVRSAGNSVSAYRLLAKEPPSPVAKPKLHIHNIFSFGDWSYEFDKELAEVGPGEEGLHQLTVRNREFWWFGFKREHKVEVEAVPVNDPTNAGLEGNTAELSYSRWRLTPIHGYILWPILALMMFFIFARGAAQDVKITSLHVVSKTPANNGLVIALAQSFVDSSQPQQIPVSYQTFAKGQAETGASPTGSGETTIEVPAGERALPSTVMAGGSEGGSISSSQIDVLGMGIRTEEAFNVFDESETLPAPRSETITPVDGKGSQTVLVVDLPVKSGTPKTITFQHRQNVDLNVLIQFVSYPAGYQVDESVVNKDMITIGKQNSQLISHKFSINLGADKFNALSEEERTLEFVSSDLRFRVVKFVLRMEP